MHDLDDEPAILTVPQCAKLLKATLDTDPGLVPNASIESSIFPMKARLALAVTSAGPRLNRPFAM